MRGLQHSFSTLVCLFASALAMAADGVAWQGLRGPTGDGAARQAILFHEGQPGLAVTWKVPIGSGYSAIAVGGGKAFTMHTAGEHDVLAAYDEQTGAQIWSYPFAPTYAGHDGSHNGPISTPRLDGERVFGLGPEGHLFALDAASGKPLWTKHVVDDLKARKPFYGFATSPIVVDGVLVLAVGIEGEGKSIAGFDPRNGELLWTAGTDKIEYQSPVAATIGGKTQIVAVGTKKLFGIEAKSGKVLWEFEHGGDESAIGGGSIVPVPAGDGRFLLVHKSDGSVMVRVEAKGSGYEASQLWANNSIRSTYAVPVYHDGHVYGMSGRIFTCVDAATGEIAWRSREPGDGFPLLVGDKLVMITKPGSLHVAEASAKGYEELASLALFDEHAWSEVAFADGHLFARSMGHLARIDAVLRPDAPTERATWLAATEFGRFLDDLERSEDKAAKIDAWLARQTSFPVVEGAGTVHFVFRGEAQDVGIVSDVIGFRREDPMTRVAGTDLFYYSTRVEPDAAATYGFIKDYAEATADPRNPRAAEGLFGKVSFFSMPAWRGAAYTQDAAAARQGRLESVEWQSKVREGQARKATLYLPAGYDPARRYPTLYVHDGKAAIDSGYMKTALDHMIGESIEPLIAVFVLLDEANPRQDLRQLDSYVEMVATELVPLVDSKYPTIATPAGRAVVGAGSAADAAMTCAFKHSELFSRVGSQSGFLGPAELGEMVRGADEQPLTLYYDWGTYHMRSPHEAWDLAAEARRTWAFLRERGYRPAGGELPEGYGWACWSAHVDDMLAALFPKS
jgi:enterochelin esterase-like enzyme/outer membrane protein assembly factor BamB